MSGPQPPSTPLTHAEVLGRYVGTFVDELVACGLEDVCLCPGSRSTPLAIAFARHPKIKLWPHLDERSCAYFALGMAKQRGGVWPVAILCSSGTAAVNFAPAVVEAYHGRVPLLVLTADRPPELQDLGSNQTIDQQNLYGSAAKWFVNLPPPVESDDLLRHVRMVASRAVTTIRSEPQGPVHLNFQFREPLMPAAFEPRVVKVGASQRLTNAWDMGAYEPSTVTPEWFKPHARGVIVCGGGGVVMAYHVAALAEAAGFPILADALSNLRSGSFVSPNTIGSYDSFLRVPALVESLAPDYILRFGDPPTSKPLASYLARHRDIEQVVVSPPERWPDPDMTASEIIYPGPDDFCINLTKYYEPVNVDQAWMSRWKLAESKTLDAIREALASDERASEPSAILDLAELALTGQTIYAGNSMPVRDVDSFWPASKPIHSFYANRGASGIDGVVSSAMGAAAHHGQVTLVIGDLSFYHDMNGLLAAKRFGINATIVLINNDGGGIFSFLPQHAEEPEHFEALFGTPHGLDFAPVAQIYGVGFQRVTTREEYRAALKASFEAPGVQVIEIKTDRDENLALHERIWAAVAKAVAE